MKTENKPKKNRNKQKQSNYQYKKQGIKDKPQQILILG